MSANTNIANNSPKKGAYVQLVVSIYASNNVPTRYKGTIKTLLQEFFSKTSKKKNPFKRLVFKQLLLHLYVQKCYAALRDYETVQALHNMSSFGNRMVRTIEDWESTVREPKAQISSLIQHCFAKYETPRFLENSFYGAVKIHMLWYVQLGSGRGVKTLSQFPKELTTKMRHAFRNAPMDLTVGEALCYSQAKGYGASETTAETIALFCTPRFWGNEKEALPMVIQCLAKEKRLNSTHLHLILDYVAHAFENDARFSLKGRTYKNLVKSAQEWQRNNFVNAKHGVLAWKPSGIKPFYKLVQEQDKNIVYSTVELLNSIALYDEGYAMHHCVAEYDKDCAAGNCSIFSLQQRINGGPSKRLATIEINLPKKTLGEYRAKFNQEPNAKVESLLEQWMANSEVERYDPETDQAVPEVQLEQLGVNNRSIALDTTEEQAVSARVIFWLIYLIIKLIIMLT